MSKIATKYVNNCQLCQKAIMSVDLPEIANLNYSPPGRFVIFCNSNNKDQESENRKRVRPDCDFFNCAAGLIASKAGRRTLYEISQPSCAMFVSGSKLSHTT